MVWFGLDPSTALRMTKEGAFRITREEATTDGIWLVMRVAKSCGVELRAVVSSEDL